MNANLADFDRVDRALEVAGEILRAASHFSISRLPIAHQRLLLAEARETEQPMPMSIVAERYRQ